MKLVAIIAACGATGVLVSQVTPLGSSKEWAEFGLVGLVVGALLTLAGYIVRRVMNAADNLTEEHRKERASWTEDAAATRREHADERREILSAIERRDERLDVALQNLTEAIREV